jgi:hypothetical protein
MCDYTEIAEQIGILNPSYTGVKLYSGHENTFLTMETVN